MHSTWQDPVGNIQIGNNSVKVVDLSSFSYLSVHLSPILSSLHEAGTAFDLPASHHVSFPSLMVPLTLDFASFKRFAACQLMLDAADFLWTRLSVRLITDTEILKTKGSVGKFSGGTHTDADSKSFSAQGRVNDPCGYLWIFICFLSKYCSIIIPSMLLVKIRREINKPNFHDTIWSQANEEAIKAFIANVCSELTDLFSESTVSEWNSLSWVQL